MTALPATLYLVVRDHGALGIGSQDVSDRYSIAFDQFAEAIEAGDPVAVLEITPACGRVEDITDFAEIESIRLHKLRGLDWPGVVRFAAPFAIAAE